MIKKSDLIIIQDSREKHPLSFKNARVEVGTLNAGDYSLKSWQSQVAVERKSLLDLLGSLGADRDRFYREIHRLRGYEWAGIVIEASLGDLSSGEWRNRITPQSVIGTLQSIAVRQGVQVFWGETRELTADLVEGLLFHFLKGKVTELEKCRPFMRNGTE